MWLSVNGYAQQEISAGSIQKKVTVAGWQQRGGYYEQNRQTLYGNDPLLSGGSEAYPAFCEGA